MVGYRRWKGKRKNNYAKPTYLCVVFYSAFSSHWENNKCWQPSFHIIICLKNLCHARWWADSVSLTHTQTIILENGKKGICFMVVSEDTCDILLPPNANMRYYNIAQRYSINYWAIFSSIQNCILYNNNNNHGCPFFKFFTFTFTLSYIVSVNS